MKHIINEFLEFVDKHSKPINELYEKSYSLEDLKEYIPDFLKQYKGGWILCSELLPEVAEGTEDALCPEFNVIIKDSHEATTLKCDPEGTWFDDSGFVYRVTAWQPLPEPYEGGEEL